MADDFGFQPEQQASPQGDNFGFQPEAPPKVPDMSGIQKMAQDNLAANNNKPKEGSAPSAPQTPTQRLDTAIGMPINSLLNENDKAQVPAAIRSNYVGALKNGSASDSSDFWQSALHSIAPIASDIGKVAASEAAKGAEYLATSSPLSITSDITQNTVNLPIQGATRLAGEAYEKLGGALSPAAAKVLTQGIPEFGQNEAKKSIRGALNKVTDYEPETTLGKVAQGAFEIAPYIVGGEGSAARKAIGIAAGSGGSEAGSEAAKALGFGEKGQQVGGVIGGTPGLIFGAGSGDIWHNYPGSDTIKDVIVKKDGKDPSAVISIEQAIATGTKDKMPSGKDFHDVAAVMGHDSPDTLHEIYKETGIRPDQVFEDARHDPQVASDIAAGKVPKAYEGLKEPPKVEEKPTPTKEEEKPAQNLQVKVSEDNKSFNVVDKDGDHVQGGFDSAEEARHYIEDKKHGEMPEEPPEWAGKEEKAPIIDKSDPFYKYQSKLGRSDEEIAAMQETRGNAPKTEQTSAGEQAVIPGAEKISDKALAERNMEKPLQSKVAQKSDIGGMFDTEARKQVDLLDMLGSKGENTSKGESNERTTGAERIRPSIHGEQGDAVLRGEAEKAGREVYQGSSVRGIRAEEIYGSAESARADARTGKLGQRPDKAGKCFESAGEISTKEKVPMVIGAVSDARGNRIYHAVNYFERGGETLIYDDTLGKYFTPEAYSDLAKWTPVKELSPSEVQAHGQRFGKWPAPDDLGLPKSSTIKYEGKQEISPIIIDNGRPLKSSIIPPGESGKPTSLSTFLRNNGAKFDENGELLSIKDENGNALKGDDALDHAGLIAQNHGYFADRPDINDLQNTLRDTNGGREHFRNQDAGRIQKQQENAIAKQQNDPAYVKHEADLAGIDTTPVKGETENQQTRRLIKALQDIYRNEQGNVATDAYRKVIGNTIIAAEKFAGTLGGDLFEKLADGYIKTFQPELVGSKAKRADAYMAKYKTSLQEAENAYYRQSDVIKRAWDKASSDERMQWLYDHETGRWNEQDNPDHARYQALYDAMHKAEKEAVGGDADKGYKENYLPHQWEDPEAVQKYFHSDAIIKKYGADWFNKASSFQLIQEGIRSGFKLKTDNPESMLVARQLASHNMIATMNLLKDMESNGLAKQATTFSLDKKIAKTEAALKEAQEKYDTANAKINDPNQLHWDFKDPAVSKYMKQVQDRVDSLKARLNNFSAEKSDNKLTPDQMAELKGNGFKIIAPDSKVWNIDQQVAPLWKNAMEMKGLWENQGAIGDAYRGYTAAKAIWTQAKLGLSLFHPFHEAIINLASGIAATADHLIQGGKLSDITLKDTGINMGLGKETFKGQDHPAVKAWNTAPDARTSEQKQMVDRMMEGGFKPTLSARDTVHFRENFDKAIAGVGLNNLRLIGTAASLPGLVMKPFFEHWIPGMKSEIYLRRYQDAINRDPSLANDAGKRGEMARQIAQDTDRTYGEMNGDVQFWDKTVKDSFNAAFISGGWKLAQIYNARGLLQPAKIAYKFAKTGEFSKSDITYNMLHAYTYTALTLATGAAVNMILGNPIAAVKDDVWDVVKNLVFPKTGENNPDGTPIRLSQPAFAKDAYMLARDINTKGLISGSGSFLYHQTLIPGIMDTLNNRDFTGRELISDATDLHQWTNAGWDFISPITVSTIEKAEAKHSEIAKYAAVLGFPMAGAYVNQTPFEQKVLHMYSEQHPPKGNVYSVELKAELKSAMASGDNKKVDDIQQRMKDEGMTDWEISKAAEVYTTPFVNTAWKKLSAEDQRRLINSASEKEKQGFEIKD